VQAVFSAKLLSAFCTSKWRGQQAARGNVSTLGSSKNVSFLIRPTRIDG
jgi:hypothetical protein